MRLSTAINIQIKLEQRLNDLYSRARTYHMTADKISSESAHIINGIHPKTPRHVKGYLRGYSSAMWRMLYNDLEFCYVIDGKIYSVYRNSERYYEKFGIKPGDLRDKPCAHFWIGTDKPFGEVKKI